MKYFHIAVIVLCFFCRDAAALAGEKTPRPLKTDAQKFSYILGSDVIGSLSRLNIHVDMRAFLEGMEDRYQHRPLKISEVEIDLVRKTMYRAEMKKRAAMKKKGSKQERPPGRVGNDTEAVK